MDSLFQYGILLKVDNQQTNIALTALFVNKFMKHFREKTLLFQHNTTKIITEYLYYNKNYNSSLSLQFDIFRKCAKLVIKQIFSTIYLKGKIS